MSHPWLDARSARSNLMEEALNSVHDLQAGR